MKDVGSCMGDFDTPNYRYKVGRWSKYGGHCVRRQIKVWYGWKTVSWTYSDIHDTYKDLKDFLVRVEVSPRLRMEKTLNDSLTISK